MRCAASLNCCPRVCGESQRCSSNRTPQRRNRSPVRSFCPSTSTARTHCDARTMRTGGMSSGYDGDDELFARVWAQRDAAERPAPPDPRREHAPGAPRPRARPRPRRRRRPAHRRSRGAGSRPGHLGAHARRRDGRDRRRDRRRRDPRAHPRAALHGPRSGRWSGGRPGRCHHAPGEPREPGRDASRGPAPRRPRDVPALGRPPAVLLRHRRVRRDAARRPRRCC